MEKSANESAAGCEGGTESSEACSNQPPFETDHQVAACKETFIYRSCDMSIDVDAMAEARWYCTGWRQIKTVCCNAVWNREATEDPWMQHAIQSPECSVLKQLKGQAYIDNVQASFPTVDEDRLLEQPNEESEIEMLQLEHDTRKKELTCYVCGENPRMVAYLPCEDLCCCQTCDLAQLKCPKCKTIIKDRIFIFLS